MSFFPGFSMREKALLTIVLLCLIVTPLMAQQRITTGVPPTPFLIRDGITASPTQLQGVLPLDFGVNVFTTVANQDDSATCPPEELGRLFQAENQGSNRLQMFPFGGQVLGVRAIDDPLFVEPGGTLTLVGLGNGTWSVLADSAATNWVDVPFSAGDFTGNGAMIWDVEVGDVSAFRYKVIGGNCMHITFSIDSSTIDGTSDDELQIAIPGGYVADGSSWTAGHSRIRRRGQVTRLDVEDLGTFVRMRPNDDGDNWGRAVDDVFVQGQITLAVKVG